MAETIKVTGGVPLKGEVYPVPNKNAIVAALPAALLTDEDVIFHNVPKSTDVLKILEMLRLLGAEVEDGNYSCVKINCRNVKSYTVDKELGNLIRASVMFAGPLLARFGKAKIPVPGGCVLGKRSIAAHVDAFSKAGIKLSFEDGYAFFEAPKKPETRYDVWQLEASVTATENLAMYAAGVESEIIITDSASEPHVTQLLELLSKMGANIEGVMSNRITVKGRNKLKGAEFTPGPDHVDVGGLVVAAAVTQGEITLKNCNIPSAFGGMIEWFRLFNIEITESGEDLVVKGSGKIFVDTLNSGIPMAGEGLPKFVPRPWPGFPVDVLPVIVTLACKNDGTVLIQNWMYETGLDYIRELNSMGANIFMADPQRIIVKGPVSFKGGKVTAPGIIQACKSIYLASLCDPVETTIFGVDVLKRRYPNFIETYSRLGAKIEGPF
jgi:UDP-N-acetylglucosamine 1-carboxyvinyltransferase